MANDSNEEIKWGLCILNDLHSNFHKGELTKLHFFCNLLRQKIIILNKMNTFLYRANLAFSEQIFIFIV